MQSVLTQAKMTTKMSSMRQPSPSSPSKRRARVHFEIEDSMPEYSGPDFLSLYKGSSSHEVTISALCSVGLFVVVSQGFFNGHQLGIVAIMFIIHAAMALVFQGAKKGISRVGSF
ncbi:hypothetical protein F5Y18DRAFT_23082 [Xylariaceae sp. FL1019]|nr:hypothetical protein F5Y18DRAFT_23082 [Xylariaceae sp. FL1019]